MNKKELHIAALATSESSPEHFSLILEEPQSKVKVPIIIGAFEAQSIAVYLERMKSPRPYTFDLYKNTIQSLGAAIKEVIIRDIVDEVFYAWIILEDKDKNEIQVDARVSDAIAAGIRFDCIISIYEHVLEEASIAESEKRLSLIRGSLTHYSTEALKDLLEGLLRKEDYESAARIRDMINKRNSS